jgi:hypothetical protein
VGVTPADGLQDWQLHVQHVEERQVSECAEGAQVWLDVAGDGGPQGLACGTSTHGRLVSTKPDSDHDRMSRVLCASNCHGRSSNCQRHSDSCCLEMIRHCCPETQALCWVVCCMRRTLAVGLPAMLRHVQQ